MFTQFEIKPIVNKLYTDSFKTAGSHYIGTLVSLALAKLSAALPKKSEKTKSVFVCPKTWACCSEMFAKWRWPNSLTEEPTKN